jgi:phosphatidylethanolamine/phosphatidyl-N-methylethanolamine N-methyltransferase
MAALVDMERPGFVVELGPGTGTVTAALLERGVAPERLVAVEYVPYFADLLRRRFPAASICQGDGFAFEDHLPPGCEVAAVISGIPLLNFEPEKRAALIRAGLKRCGRFIQLSYGWQPPIPPGRGMDLQKTIVWRNFPPAHVWTYSIAA